MRKLTPLPVVTSLALALAAGAAFAQARQATGSPGATDTGPTIATSRNSVQAEAPSATAGNAAGVADAAQPGLGPDPGSPAAVTSPNDPRVSNTNPTGGTLSPGTSTGTAPIATTSGTTATATNPIANTATGAITAGGVGGTVTVPGVVAATAPAANPSGTITQTTTTTIRTTPILDQAARNATARQAARRARGEPATIIGLAPRTNADLTHQMPDDPIIRY